MKEKEVNLLKFEDYSNQLVDVIQAQVHFENLIITKLETQNILNNKYFENNNDALKVAIDANYDVIKYIKNNDFTDTIKDIIVKKLVHLEEEIYD